MNEQYPHTKRAHAKCSSRPMGNEDGLTTTEREEIVFFDLSSLVHSAVSKAERVYVVSQLPQPPRQRNESFHKNKIREKNERVQKEKKVVARNLEKRLKAMSRTYCIDVPPPVAEEKHPLHLPQIHQKKHQAPMYKGSRFRATLEDRSRHSHSYDQFVGRLSYLINLSRQKVKALYGEDGLPMVKEFLGRKTPSDCDVTASQASDTMAPFRQRQFCIGSTMRKLLPRGENPK